MESAETQVSGVPFARLIRHARAARRLRFEVPRLLRNRELARDIERAVSRREGVTGVEADERSGRVLILYREGAGEGEPIRALAEGAPEQVWRAPPAAPASESSPDAAHTWTVAAALARLDSEPQGLSSREAARRLRKHGPNDVGSDPRTPWYRILVRQVANLPTALLVGSAGVSLLLGDVLEAGAIFTVLGLNTGIGFEVERRSEALLASWRTLDATSVDVLRGGARRRIASTKLVPGDVIVLGAGSIVPADGRALESDRLACDESVLTGESEPRPKGPAPVAAGASLGERSSMVYAGTVVVGGSGRVLVTATGWSTELAQVRALVERSQAPIAPLEQRMNELTNRPTHLSVDPAPPTPLASLVRGRPLLGVLRSSVALGVAAIPEGLPLVSTATLVHAMARLRRTGIVVRRLSAAETLGTVTVVAADKTGTLTENRMRLERLVVHGGPVELAGLRASRDPFADGATLALASAVLNSTLHEREHGRGLVAASSTEQALVNAAEQAGIDVARLVASYPRLVMKERQERIHFVTSVHGMPDGGRVAFVKGAPEQVIGLCAATAGGALDDQGRARILADNQELASEGLRVLAVAWRRSNADAAPEGGYTFVGLLALRDPLRPTARTAVQNARAVGVRTVILTGDQSATAAAIARQLGLEGDVMEGSQVQRLLDDDGPDGRARLARVAVFSRVTPADKLAIIKALRAAGEVVAMAGDGVNDAPALKAADVSIAVGRGSTDLARQTAGVVLDSENLESIIAAIREGRVIHDNLHRTVRFLFATNLSEVALMLGGALLGFEPLTALQLLWINLLTDTLPGLALAFEPGDPAAIRRPPLEPGPSFLGREGWRQVGRDGVLLGVVGAFGYALGGPAAAFASLPAAQLGYGAVCRVAGQPDVAPPSHRFAVLVGGSVALHATALAFPPLRRALRLPLTLGGSFLGLAAVALPWLASRFERWRKEVRWTPLPLLTAPASN
jgi:P-type Ca2+ transporter type 2C